MKRRFSILAGCLITCFFAPAQDISEQKMPSFGVDSKVAYYPSVQWIQGTPINKLDKKNIYVIECWATWCSPCIASIPHLNTLSKKFKGKIIFIGQSVWEEDRKKVEQFVKEKGDEMSYAVAFSGRDESDFAKKWLTPGHISAIPQTFVIHHNKIVWMTHPASLSERNLQLLVNNKFSIQAAEEMSPLKNLKDAEALIEENKIAEAGIKIDEALKDYPGFSYGNALKIKWLKLSGKKSEARDLAKAFSISNPYEGKNIYYDELMDAQEYDSLTALLEQDLVEIPTDFNAIMLLYKIFTIKNDYKSAANLINTATAVCNEPAVLSSLALIDKYLSDTLAHAETDKAMLMAGQKALSLDPGQYSVAIAVAKRLWETDKEKAKASLLKAAASQGKTEKEIKRAQALEQIINLVNKNIFPDEKQIREIEAVVFN